MMNLYQGDCLQVLKTFPDNVVDLVVTSPPYDNLRAYEGTLFFTFELFQQIAKELYRVLVPGGVVVWVVNDGVEDGSETGTSFRQALYFKEIGLRLHDTMIYHAEKPPLTHNRYEQKFEYMFVLSKGKPKTFNPLTEPKTWVGTNKKNFGRNKDGSHDKGIRSASLFKRRGNVWHYEVGGGKMGASKEAHQHPAIFPLQLAKDHIVSWSNPGEVVLDPFMGSGTTGQACKETGREFVGIEVVPKYFEIAKARTAL